MTGAVYVVSCGARKLPHEAPAWRLYTGPYFTALIGYARRHAPLDRIYILSAKYGFVPATRTLPPYNVTIGDPGAVSVSTLRRQATDLGIADAQVVVLGGKRYVTAVQGVWPNVDAPLQRVKGGMGAQISWLRRTP